MEQDQQQKLIDIIEMAIVKNKTIIKAHIIFSAVIITALIAYNLFTYQGRINWKMALVMLAGVLFFAGRLIYLVVKENINIKKLQTIILYIKEHKTQKIVWLYSEKIKRNGVMIWNIIMANDEGVKTILPHYDSKLIADNTLKTIHDILKDVAIDYDELTFNFYEQNPNTFLENIKKAKTN